MEDRAELARLAADPATPLATLQELARDHPELRPALALNPSTYPALLEWLGRLGSPDVDAALATRAVRVAAQVSGDAGAVTEAQETAETAADAAPTAAASTTAPTGETAEETEPAARTAEETTPPPSMAGGGSRRRAPGRGTGRSGAGRRADGAAAGRAGGRPAAGHPARHAPGPGTRLPRRRRGSGGHTADGLDAAAAGAAAAARRRWLPAQARPARPPRRRRAGRPRAPRPPRRPGHPGPSAAAVAARPRGPRRRAGRHHLGDLPARGRGARPDAHAGRHGGGEQRAVAPASPRRPKPRRPRPRRRSPPCPTRQAARTPRPTRRSSTATAPPPPRARNGPTRPPATSSSRRSRGCRRRATRRTPWPSTTPSSTGRQTPPAVVATLSHAGHWLKPERPAPAGARKASSFSSPTGNISCALGDDAATCTIGEHHFDTPKGCSAERVTVTVGRGGDARPDCSVPPAGNGGALPYGQSATAGHFACTSRQDGWSAGAPSPVTGSRSPAAGCRRSDLRLPAAVVSAC